MTTTATTHLPGPSSQINGGISLRGLAKSYRGPQGPIHAVRGIDVLDRRRRDRGAARPQRRRQVDDDRHAARASSKPDAARCPCSAGSPREAVDAGLVGAMLQTGELIRDLSVRELVAMMASLYPDPMDVDEALELTGLTATAAQRTQKLSGGQTQRVRFRGRDRQQSRPAGARRADGRAGRRGPPRVLEHHARVRRPGQDGPVRHPLPRGGRRQRRPRDPDGPRADRRRRPDDRDQGARRKADDPRDAPGRRSRRAWPRCPASPRPSATATR